MDDRTLIERAQAGDREAFGQLAEACRPWLYGLCFRLVRDWSTAEDLVQQSLVQAWRDLAQLRDAARFHAWLAQVAVNICRMHLRRLRSRPEEPLPADQDSGFAPPSPSADGEDAPSHLSPTDRRLLTLFHCEGLSHAELAEVLALSPSAVKSRLHRARDRLRKEMLATMSENEKKRLGVAEEGTWVLRTILLVEPEDALREALREGLTAAGYQVVVLSDGEAALDAIKARRGDMLILDKHSDPANWIETLTLIQADAWARENVPVGVLVDPDNQRDVFLAWHAGAMLCLTRPPSTQEVVEFVKRIERAWPEGWRGGDETARRSRKDQ